MAEPKKAAKKDILDKDRYCTTDIEDMKLAPRETLDEDKVVEPSKDLRPSEFVEKAEDSIAPQLKEGSEEVNKSTRSKRFAIEHEETTDKDSILRKQLKMKTDKPADTQKTTK